MKPLKFVLKTAAVCAALSLVLCGVNEHLNSKVRVTRYTYTDVNVPDAFDGYKIMAISDLHEAPFSSQIIEHIRSQEPDMIVFTGDMAQLPHKSVKEALKIGKAVKDIPMYAVSGNHETQNESYGEIMGTLWGVNIVPMDDNSICIKRGDDRFLLIGSKDPRRDEPHDEDFEAMRDNIRYQLPREPIFSVLLMHRSDLYPEVKDTDVDLILSGHMHGGIIRLPLVGGLIGDEGKITLPKYDYGMFKEGNAAMIVSGGCDKNPDKKRFFNPPEVVMITLEQAEAE